MAWVNDLGLPAVEIGMALLRQFRRVSAPLIRQSNVCQHITARLRMDMYILQAVATILRWPEGAPNET
jgi:hypothetical protein